MPSPLLSNRPLVPLELELGDTLVLWLAIDNTLGHGPLSATTPDTDTVNNIALKTNSTKLSPRTGNSYSQFIISQTRAIF